MLLVRKALGKEGIGTLLYVALLSSSTCGSLSNKESYTLENATVASPSRSATPKEAKPKPWENIYFDDINQRTGAAGLRKLREVELTPGSLEIRIWAGFDLTSLRALVLKRTRDEWSAVYLPPLENSREQGNAALVLGPPRSGWDPFWNRLVNQDILTLPDASDVGADNVYPDALGVVVEIRTDDSYRAFNYNGFETSEREEAKKVVGICTVVSEELKIKLC